MTTVLMSATTGLHRVPYSLSEVLAAIRMDTSFGPTREVALDPEASTRRAPNGRGTPAPPEPLPSGSRPPHWHPRGTVETSSVTPRGEVVHMRLAPDLIDNACWLQGEIVTSNEGWFRHAPDLANRIERTRELVVDRAGWSAEKPLAVAHEEARRAVPAIVELTVTTGWRQVRAGMTTVGDAIGDLLSGAGVALPVQYEPTRPTLAAPVAVTAVDLLLSPNRALRGTVERVWTSGSGDLVGVRFAPELRLDPAADGERTWVQGQIQSSDRSAFFHPAELAVLAEVHTAAVVDEAEARALAERLARRGVRAARTTAALAVRPPHLALRRSPSATPRPPRSAGPQTPHVG